MTEEKKNWKAEYCIFGVSESAMSNLLDIVILYVESHGGQMTGIQNQLDEFEDTEVGDENNGEDEGSKQL